MLRISAKTSNMAARLRPARTSNSPRCFARPRHIGSSREHGHFPDATLRWRFVSPPGRMADLTDGGPPQGVGLTLRRQAACGSADRAHATIASQPAHYALPSKSQIRWLRARATRQLAGDAVTRRPGKGGRCSLHQRLRGWLSRTTGEAYGAPASAPVASPCSPVLHTTHIVRSLRSLVAVC